MKVYVVLTGYSDPEGGGDFFEGVYDTFDKAEAYVLKQIAEDKDWKRYNRRVDINTWDEYYEGFENSMSHCDCRIEEHEVQ